VKRNGVGHLELRLGFHKNTIQDINIDDIKANPYQNRSIIEEESLKELAESIRRHGLLQPILVRKVGKEFLLVSGERRLRASHIAGLKQVCAVVKEMTDAEAAAATIVENIQREDVSFLDEAAGFNKLNQEFGMTQQEIADSVGKSQSYVANKIRLLGLSATIREIISREIKVSERHCRALLRLGDEDTQMRFLLDIIDNNLTTEQTDRKVEKYVKEMASKSPHQKKKMIIKDIRIFLNDVKSALNTLTTSGIDTEWLESEGDEFYEFKIRIRKNGRDSQ